MMSFRHLLHLFAVGAAIALAAAAGPVVTAGGADTGKKDAAEKKPESENKKEETRPACMHCGATCGLVAFCECKPGTKTTQKTEYDTTCDPVCVPGCSGFAWPWNRRHEAGCTSRVSGCTEDCDGGCGSDCCRAWVRQRKKLVKETKDEEKRVIERKVVWVCRGCTSGCTAPSRPASMASGWWPAWLCWPHAGH